MRHSTILILLAILLGCLSSPVLAPPAFADKGVIAWPPVHGLEESAQNAIVGWNGKEEVLILSTDMRASGESIVLEMLPLPNNPREVKEADLNSFERLAEMIRIKQRRKQPRLWLGQFRDVPTPGVEITFHEQIGPHEVTVVKVNDLDYFLGWINSFTQEKGLEAFQPSDEFKRAVASYLEREIRFFVFDVVSVGNTRQTVNPLCYRFESDFLYYPLEITAFSSVGMSIARVHLFLIAKGRIDESAITKVKLSPEVGFDSFLEFNEEELREINQDLADLFASDPVVVSVRYDGHLNRLDKDLVVQSDEIHVLSLYERIFEQVRLYVADIGFVMAELSPFVFIVGIVVITVAVFYRLIIGRRLP